MSDLFTVTPAPQPAAPTWPYLPWRVEPATGRTLDPIQIVNALGMKLAYVGSRETAELIVQAVNAGQPNAAVFPGER